MSKALSFTAVFSAHSLNYGEGISNISELKKIHRANGDVHTFSSRQSIRYDIVRMGNELFDWNLDTVFDDKGTLQFRDEVTIEDSVEMDLFGYLKTGKKSLKRPAVVRLSHAVSLEPYRSDMEFLNNMGLASRIGKNANLANIEQHQSLYSYTITVDLAKVGKDEDIELDNEEKFTRVQQLLAIVKLLNRHIRGRQENLAPLFVIGGVYDVANPFFLGRVQLKKGMNRWELNDQMLRDSLTTSFAGKSVQEQTHIGIISGTFDNENEMMDLVPHNQFGSVEDFFQSLELSVESYYGVEK